MKFAAESQWLKWTRLKRTLFNKTIQYTHFLLIYLFKDWTRQLKTTETNKKVTYLNLNGSSTEISSPVV